MVFKMTLGGGRVTINGVEIVGERNIAIESDGTVIVDGVARGETLVGPVDVVVHGNADHIETISGRVEVSGQAVNVKTTSGDVRCGDVAGNVSTISGDITASDIRGNVSSVSGDIRVVR